MGTGLILEVSVIERIRVVGSKVMGSKINVRLVEGMPPAREVKPNNSKIDKLMQFSNVKFE